MKRLSLGVLLLVCAAGCGRQLVQFPLDGGSDAGQTGVDSGTAVSPVVDSTVPVNGASAVPLNTSVSAVFTKTMDATTLDGTSFTLMQGATAVSGAVSYDATSQTATFTPATPLDPNQVYTATLTTAVKDTDGLPLLAAYSWNFTTAADANPPIVTSTTPMDGDGNVSINKRPTATFSKAMNPSTLNAQTFLLKQGATPISGSVRVNGVTHTATFTPDAPLTVGVPYTATITTGAKDSGNNALAANYTWSFTTSACSQAPVNLRSAAGFAVLAGSTVTNTGPTSITGDLGVSPGTAVTGFPPGKVVGTLHKGDPTAATGIADLTTAYNDAAGRTLCAVTVSGNIGGRTLAPGLYKSTSSLAVSSGDLTLDAQGDGDAVFIFQMASTLDTTSGRKVFLTNGAKATNVFWKVGSSATLGTMSVFQGTIMADQAITLTTGATLTGRALARIGAVALDSNTVVKPAP